MVENRWMAHDVVEGPEVKRNLTCGFHWGKSESFGDCSIPSVTHAEDICFCFVVLVFLEFKIERPGAWSASLGGFRGGVYPEGVRTSSFGSGVLFTPQAYNNNNKNTHVPSCVGCTQSLHIGYRACPSVGKGVFIRRWEWAPNIA